LIFPHQVGERRRKSQQLAIKRFQRVFHVIKDAEAKKLMVHLIDFHLEISLITITFDKAL
jgi:hypothetical protein